MSDKQLDRDADSVRRENARVGYQAAAELWGMESQESWDRFNVMAFMNSIIIGIVGLAIVSQPSSKIFVISLSVVGLFLCATWFLIMKRGFEYAQYLVWSARELEERYLADPIKTLSRGGNFMDGKVAQFEIGGKRKDLPLSRWARIAKAETLSYLIVVLFAIMYVIMIWQTASILSRILS